MEPNITRIQFLSKISFCETFPSEKLASGAQGTPISTQTPVHKTTWKRAGTKNIILALGAQKAFKMEFPNRLKSMRFRLQTPTCPSCCSHCFPGCPRGTKMVLQGAKMEAPGLPNHSSKYRTKDGEVPFSASEKSLRTNIQKPTSQHTLQQRNSVTEKPNNKNPTTQKTIRQIRT